MTDRELITALEKCAKGTECERCPLDRSEDCCNFLMAEAAERLRKLTAIFTVDVPEMSLYIENQGTININM